MISSPSSQWVGSPDVRALRALRPPLPAHEASASLHPLHGSAASNRLWACLPAAHRENLLPSSELVLLRRGASLMHADQPCTHVYFPCSAVVSLVLTTQAGKSCQVGMIGNDGMVGVHGVVGGQRLPYDAVVRTEGTARRVSAKALGHECAPGSAGAELFTRYSQALMVQMAYAAVCCQHHNVEQRTCRFLLHAFDAAGSELYLTQEVMAECLGVRRESVTDVAHRLHQSNVIRYSRGQVVLCDRDALQARSCECYDAVKHELEMVFDDTASGRVHRPLQHPRSMGAYAAAN